MPGWLKVFVRAVEAMNYRIGRIASYLFCALAGVLLWSIVCKVFFTPPLWTQEMGQFILTGYFVIGGAYSLQLGSNVRMDIVYCRLSTRNRALIDAISVFAMIFFLGVILYGGIDSTLYAFEYGERSRTVWRPYMAPIKIVICIGTLLMLLQSICYLIRDIAYLRGEEI